MKTSNLGLYAVAAAIAFVGALVVGVPLGALAALAIILTCPLMMIFMMKGMQGGGLNERDEPDHRRDPRSHH